jgi:replication factor C small subunit
MKKHSLWVEKYRPDSLKNYIGNEDFKSTIKKYIDQNDLPNIILFGPPGTGKTTLSKLIIKNIDCDYLYINASDENSIDTIRDKVKSFASTATFKSLKVIILDEADYLTINAQSALRNIIETFSKSTRFIFTCNYIERIMEPIQSRCHVFKLNAPSKKEIAIHVSNILNTEQVSHEINDLALIINSYYPDIRKVLNNCQINSNSGQLVVNKKEIIESNYLLKILKILTKPDSKSFNDIRQIIADSEVKEFNELFKFLFENLEVYGKRKESELILILAEMEYQSSFVIDKEINALATISKILNIL